MKYDLNHWQREKVLQVRHVLNDTPMRAASAIPKVYLVQDRGAVRYICPDDPRRLKIAKQPHRTTLWFKYSFEEPWTTALRFTYRGTYGIHTGVFNSDIEWID